ncbi:MAG: N-acetylmuramoyl-L-alanine amidase [Spirochaetes bacterium]|nr:N-acetylmuramoyl-L-alanine amidase [Spirochaetota bacterium]
MRKDRIRILAFLAVVMTTSAVPAQELAIRSLEGKRYVSTGEMTARLDLQQGYDLVTQKCRLYRQRHQAVFHVNMAVYIVDGGLCRSEYAVRRHQGEVLVPLDAAEHMLRAFYRDGVHVAGNSISIAADGGESQGKKDSAGDKKIRPADGLYDDRISFIVLDPGHGGKDPGAIGRNGAYEKRITLAVSRLVNAKLRSKLKNVRILTTRGKDVFIPLARRTEIANMQLKRKSNGLFLSIHVNASLSPKISGYETYFLSQNPTNEEARNTATLENNVIMLEEKGDSEKGYGDIDYIEAMMLTTQIQKESALLAESIQRGMRDRVRRFKSRGVKKADFFVLRGVIMPACLVEIGYITHRQEASFLLKKSHQADVADGIVRGVVSFIERYNRLVRKSEKNP